ncbi:ABC transporter permease [Spiroplasma endosymbiont of Amphibalanus improvisus]|uniref:ABC transporter permease n=1 Tax=Spiroplasma endosymbiont of Amphibalanus improvisus TaxID=3066327 RepID=UPI00313E2199
MKYIVKNFLKFLSKNFMQLIGLFVAIVTLVCLTTSFFISSSYGQAKIDEMQSSGFLNSMIVEPQYADFNVNVFPNTDYNNFNNDLLSYMDTAKIRIISNGDGSYGFQLSDPEHNDLGIGGNTGDSKMGQIYNFEPPINDQDDDLYIDFFPLKGKWINLLPISNDQIWNDYNGASSQDKDQINQDLDLLFSISNYSKDQSATTYTKKDFDSAANISKTIVWDCIVGVAKDASKSRTTTVATYYDILNQTSIIISPQSTLDSSFSAALPDNKFKDITLQDDECFISKDYMNNNNLNVGDQIEMGDQKLTIKGTATSSVFNSLYGNDLKNKEGIWVSDDIDVSAGQTESTFDQINNTIKGNPNYTYDNNYYFNISDDDLTINQNDQNFYNGKLLNAFVRIDNSDLNNHYFKIEYPNSTNKNTIGVYGLNAFQEERNHSLFSIILIASIFLQVLTIAMIINIVAYIIKNHVKAIGILKANGFKTIRIVNSIASAFVAILLAIGLASVLFSFLFGLVITSTYNTQMDINSWSFNVNWTMTLIAFFSPLLIVLPMIYLSLILFIKRPALFLIKDVKDNKKIKIYNNRFALKGMYTWIYKIKVSYRIKFASKLIWDSKTKILSVLFFTTLTIVVVFLVININSLILETNTTAQKAINGNYAYQYNNQQLINNNPKVKTNYQFEPVEYNDDDANKLKDPTQAAGKYIMAEDIPDQFIEKLNGLPKELITQLQLNGGRILFGYQSYDPNLDQLGIYQSTDNIYPVYLQNNNFWKGHNPFINYKNNYNLIFPSTFSNISFNPYQNENIDKTIDLQLTNYDYNDFLKAPYCDKDNIDKLKDYARQTNNIEDANKIIAGIDEIENTLIPKIDDSISISLVPVAINKSYKEVENVELGDSFLSYSENNDSIDIYIVFDWLESLNNSFILTPYGFACDNISNEQNNINTPIDSKPTVPLYNWKLSLNTELEYTNNYISIISPTNNYNLTDPNSDLTVNISGIINNDFIYGSIESELNGLRAIIDIIAILSIGVTLVQTLLTVLVLIKSNLNIINTLKAFGYTDAWINGTLFFIYIPIILLACAFAMLIVSIFSILLYWQVLSMTGVYVVFHLLGYFIIIIGFFFLLAFIILLLFGRRYSDRKFPLYKHITA